MKVTLEDLNKGVDTLSSVQLSLMMESGKVFETSEFNSDLTSLVRS
jgi:hypothetical protein